MLVLVKSFSFNDDASFSEESLTPLKLVLVRSIAYIPSGSFKVEFLLHTLC